MKRTFVYLQHFDKAWMSLGLTNEKNIELEKLLLENPGKGSVISGTGGLRKIRVGLEGKGKSGGLRILYVDFEQYERLYLLFVYAKGEKEDITEYQKKQFKSMINLLLSELKRREEKS
ncbi:MAG: type II toxin-antitoxin system RelE/ParE family toxin [Oscillospiraceae bacterium]|nr:type II toxin-antitoxin system RelE/ParE family toxin [Oscillospiraceae bacterium]